MDEILSLNEVCDYLKLAKSTVYKLSRTGTFPSAIVGRQLRFRKTRINAWLDTQEKLKARMNTKKAKRKSR